MELKPKTRGSVSAPKRGKKKKAERLCFLLVSCEAGRVWATAVQEPGACDQPAGSRWWPWPMEVTVPGPHNAVGVTPVSTGRQNLYAHKPPRGRWATGGTGPPRKRGGKGGSVGCQEKPPRLEDSPKEA